MSGFSRAVDPATGRPLDLDRGPGNLDLPPRRPREINFAPTDGMPRWARVLPAVGWVTAGVLWLLVLTFFSTSVTNVVVGTLACIALGAVAHIVGAQQCGETHRQHRSLVLAQVNSAYDQALSRWMNSRPLRRVAQAANPLSELRAVMAERSASLALGVVPDTQELATAGRQSSVLVLAPSQMGKTTCLAAPMLLAHFGPAVVTSTKPDLINWTAKVRADRGQIWIFDPAGDWVDKRPPGVREAYWSPLWSSTTWKSARITADSMLKATAVGRNENGVHWTVTAKMFLSPCLLAAALHPDLTMVDVLEWVADRNFDPAAAVLTAVAKDPDHPRQLDATIAWRSMRSILRTTGDQQDGIFGTVTTVLEAYNAVHVEQHAARQNFDPAAFVRSGDTVYVAAKSNVQGEIAPVIVAFIDAIQQAGYDLDEAEPFHASTRPSVLMCIDEAANVAPMRELPRYLSEAGGQGVQIVAFFQSLRQAAKVWPAEAPGFLDYFATIVAFGGITDDATLEALSVLSGDYDRQYVSNSFSATTSQGISRTRTTSFLNPPSSSVGSNGGTSATEGTSTSHHKERRLTKADIATLAPRHALVATKHERTNRGGNFAILEMVPVYESPWPRLEEATPVVLPRTPDHWQDLVRPVVPLPTIDELLDDYEDAKVSPESAQAAASS